MKKSEPVTIVDGAAWFLQDDVDLVDVMRELTVTYYKMGEPKGVKVEAFNLVGDYIQVPRDYGLQLIAKLGHKAILQYEFGAKAHFPKKVVHTGKWEYQEAVVENMLRTASEQHDFIMQAMTGSGKTVMALSAAQKLGRATLVIVDQENLMLQWVEQCKEVLGLPASKIGRVQGKVCDFKGKTVVIAMVHSLVQRDYVEELYQYFGTVIFDEVHTIGAPTFSKALLMFPATVRFGISATVKRSDALQSLIHWNLGSIEVELSDTHEASYLYYLESNTVYSWYANISPKTGRILTEIANDTSRNALIVEAIRWMHKEGRDTLVIGDRIEQLEALMAMAYYSGVPMAAMGLYTGMRSVWQYVKDPTPKRRPEGYVKGTEYTPVAFRVVRKKTPKKELDRVKEVAPIIFATYGMFSKGVDVPRLSGGIDCSPRAKAAQTHGRILRVQNNKLVPIWVTIRDPNSYRLEYQFLQRLADYVSDSSEVYKWELEKGVRLVDVKKLRSQVQHRVRMLRETDIVTNSEGCYMLHDQNMQIR